MPYSDGEGERSKGGTRPSFACKGEHVDGNHRCNVPLPHSPVKSEWMDNVEDKVPVPFRKDISQEVANYDGNETRDISGYAVT